MYANAFMCLFIYILYEEFIVVKHIHLTLIWHVTLFVHRYIDIYYYVCVKNELHDLWSWSSSEICSLKIRRADDIGFRSLNRT